MSSVCRAFCLLLIVLPGAIGWRTCRAQNPAMDGVLTGSVEDPTGARIPRAAVHVEGPGLSLDTVSDSVGRFSMALPPGTYEVTVLSAGFKPSTQSVSVDGGTAGTRLDVVLAIAPRADEIAVPANTASSTSANENQSALVLGPVEMQTFSDDEATFEKEVLSLAGGTGRAPQLFVDGFSGGRFPPKNSIRAVRINRNPYSAYYDSLGFGRVEIDTKPGTDKLHGSFNSSGNDAALNARDPFTTGPQPPYYVLNLDGNLTGPLDKRTSFFVAGTYNDQQNNTIVNAEIPAVVSEAVPNPQTLATYSARVDRQMSGTNTLTARYEFNQVNLTNGGVGLLVLPTEGYNSGTTTQTLQLSDEQILGMKTVNQARFQYVRTRVDQAPVGSSGANCGAAVSYSCTVVVEGSFAGGGDPTGVLRDDQDHYEFQDMLSVEHRKHFLRAGMRYRLLRDANFSTANYNGQFTYSSLASFNAGEPGQFNVTKGQPSAVLLTGDLAVYAEDEWKPSANLTLDYGFRFESESGIPDHFDPAPRLGGAWAIRRKKAKLPLVVLRSGFAIFYDRFPAPDLLTTVRQNGVSQQTYYETDPGYTTYDPANPPPTLTAAAPTIYRISPRFRSEYNITGGLSAERSFGRYGTASVNYYAVRGVHQFLSRNVNAPEPGTFIYDPSNPADANSGVRPFGGTQNIYEFDSDGVEHAQLLYFNTRLNPVRRVTVFGSYVILHNFTDANGPTAFASNSYNLAQDYGRATTSQAQQLFTGGSLQLPWGVSSDLFFSAQTGMPFNITTGTDLNGDSIYNDRPSFATGASPAGSVVATRFGTFDTTPQPGETMIPINYGKSPAFVYLQLAANKSFAFGPRPRAAAAAGAKAPAAKPDAPYHLSFSVEADNLINHANPGLPVGVLNSPFFGKSISLATNFSNNTAANRVIALRTSFSF